MNLAKLVRLDRAWRRGDPEQVRQECDSFVLSLEIVECMLEREQEQQRISGAAAADATAAANDNGASDDGKKKKKKKVMTVVIGLNNGDIEEWDLGTQGIKKTISSFRRRR